MNSHCLRTAASATTTEADSGYNSCGNTVGAVIPTARACSARGLYRRSGFSPCPEDMRLQTYINFRKNNRIIQLIGKKLIIQTIYNIFALLNQKVYHLQPARMAESVDALVSNTSGAIRAGSIPAPGTRKCKCLIFRHLHFFFLLFAPRLHHVIESFKPKFRHFHILSIKTALFVDSS